MDIIDNKYDVIILASGVGSRCGLDYPKQFYKTNDKTMLSYVIDIFKSVNGIGNIIVTYTPNMKDLFSDEINLHPHVLFVEGGNTRQESVYNALQHVQSDKVIIHESVRPFITKEYIEQMMSTKEDCLVSYLPITTTVYYADQFEYVNRDSLYNIQLPQIFNCNKLKKAHDSAKLNNHSYTDDSSLYFTELNETISFIKGLEENIKITTKFDLELLRKLGDDYSEND